MRLSEFMRVNRVERVMVQDLRTLACSWLDMEKPLAYDPVVYTITLCFGKSAYLLLRVSRE